MIIEGIEVLAVERKPVSEGVFAFVGLPVCGSVFSRSGFVLIELAIVATVRRQYL